ncbi:hypothetical protein Nocox_03880 [Nonomuraea coxensis DSM 45129]|uniref:Uncharacterized protein n=1 Tax=Nonomuraea coxensis DSM 45129 TaxID=1122611 RepID=A0ABX8TSZ5_9ACTN|nr:hypothetical protein [Nonomuraea coxensis]QYC38404.1 hypothetical protein Nocox_03880 [Nonomuraea coxensis DSM 45129]
MDIDHKSMEAAGKAIHDEGGEFATAIRQDRTNVEALRVYLGGDEAAMIFRRGKDGHPGFDSAYQDLSDALNNLSKSYEAIGAAVTAMSKNVKAADWANMVDKNAFVHDLVEFAKQKPKDIAVPTTPVELA